MKFTHKHLDEMYRAYAASVMEINDETVCMVASEEKGYPCYMYYGDEFEKRQTVWEKGGGCMSIIPIPGKKNEFLAVMDFYLKVSPSKSKLVWVSYDKEEGFKVKDLVYLPFLHRFDIYQIEGENYVVCATISDHKENKEDWSRPGSIYMAKLGARPEDGLDLKKISTGYFRNHGYYRYEKDGRTYGYFTSDQGVVKLDPYDNWKFEKVLDGQIGEIAVMDIDDDGVEEFITIEAFHGNSIKIYKKDKETGDYKVDYIYPNKIDFAHTLVGAEINKKKCFVGGVRRINSELFVISYEDGDYKMTLVDEGAGPSNLAVGSKNGRDFIISANHTRNEVGLYWAK